MATTETPPQGTVPENALTVRRMGIDTQHEAVIFMRKDCHVCRSEGFTAHTRVRVENGRHAIIATLFQVTGGFLQPGEAGLSESAWERLGTTEGGVITVSHPRPLESMSLVRSKIYGTRLSNTDLHAIVTDIVAGRYSDVALSALITACSARPLDRDETVSLTGAMVDAGDRLHWDTTPVVDKHCVGGLPGNRTTPIVVAIATACGLTMPKTSSRAITSPAGTADTMETLAPVELSLADMRRVVEREGGCIMWGGAVRLSPADDIFIRVERALDIDSEGQLVASVLSKKIAAGSTHVVLDLPVGPTAKIRSPESADSMETQLSAAAGAFGLHTKIVRTDGSQPVGHGIGPALEAHDVLAVLQGTADAPTELRDRSIALAGALLELGGVATQGAGVEQAMEVLASGRAWSKFQAICDAQGGMRVPPSASHQHPVVAVADGRVTAIDNRRIARVAKLAGAPHAKAAGLKLHARVGDRVEAGQPIYTVHAETGGELAYALAYAQANPNIFQVQHP